MDVRDFPVRGGVGDDRTLGDLPDAVERASAVLEDADGDTVEVEVGQLPVGLGAEADAAVVAESEEVHQLGVVGVVDPVGELPLLDRVVYHGPGVVAAVLAHDGRVDMAVEDTGDVVAVVDGDELAAERVAVTVLEEDLLAGVVALRPEVHREGRPVEGQAAQGHAVDGLVLGDLDGRGIGDDLGRVVESLLRIVELDAPDLGRRLDRDEGMEGVRDDEERSGGLAVRDRAAAGGTVDADQGHVLLQDDAALDGIAAFHGLHIERRAAAGGPVDGVLEADPVDGRVVGRQDVEGLDGVGERGGPVLRGNFDFLDDVSCVFDGLPDHLGAGHQGEKRQQRNDLRFHGWFCLKKGGRVAGHPWEKQVQVSVRGLTSSRYGYRRSCRYGIHQARQHCPPA